jgi:raffinose/stachyose/melibiose transport system permease protein
MSIRKTVVRVGLQVPLVAWTLVTLVPFVLILLLSFRNNSDQFAHPLGFGGHYQAQNYKTAWKGETGSAGMADYFRNTVLAAATALVVSLVVGSTAAYFATKMGRRARQWLLRAFLLGSVVPFVLLLIPYYQTFNALGVINSPTSLGVVYGVLALPTTVLILHSYYSDFPEELIDAAAVDGLSEFGAYLRVVLPLSKGALTAVGITTLVYVWGEAQIGIVLLQQPASQTVAVGMLSFQGQFTSSLGPLFAGLSIATVPVIILYLIFNRYVTKGIALGGVFR